MSFLQFLDFDIILSTNFAENMNSALPSNRTLPYFEEILVNALLLQNYENCKKNPHMANLE